MTAIEIKNRFTNAVLFTCEVAEDDAYPIRTALVKAIEGGAYLRGAYLGDADLGDADLRGAYLGGADLRGADLRDADLRGAYLGGADLGGADLGGADLGDADLGGADLRGADLRGADLRGVLNKPASLANHVDPTEPYVRRTPEETERPRITDEERQKRRIERARLYREAHPEVPFVEALDAKILRAITVEGGTLDMGDWHHGDACGTTHCRAGWAIFLAGKAGADLERKHGPEIAGRKIYLASTGRAPHFFTTDERALEDIKRCAAEQVSVSEAQP